MIRHHVTMPTSKTFATIDLTSMPWSTYGSWLNFSRPQMAEFQPLGPGLYLRSNHSRGHIMRELARIQLISDGKIIEPVEEVHPDRLVLKPSIEATTQIEIIFDRDGNIGIQSDDNLGLLVRAAIPEAGIVRHQAAHVVAYEEANNRFVLNIRTAIRRYGFQCTRGLMTMDAPFDRERSLKADITLLPSGDGSIECWIDEFWSSWQPKRRSFSKEKTAISQRWQKFQDNFAAVRRKDQQATSLAQWLLWSSIVPPAGLIKRPAILMSRNWMDQVWSWDNCFNAASLAGAHPKLAEDQFLVVADHQDEFGAYPDGINDGFKHYNFSKPPVQGILANWIEQRNPSYFTPARTKTLWRTWAAFTDWWLEQRRLPGAKLCHYLHGNDSGWDNTSLMNKGAPLTAPDLNAFLIRQCRWLAQNSSTEKAARHFNAEADQLSTALVEELWNGEQFIAHLRDGTEVATPSLVTCMPLVIGDDLPTTIQRKVFKHVQRCVTDYGVATEPPDSPYYDPHGYWRGPIWGPSTLLVIEGLIQCKNQRLAKKIAKNYCATCDRSGFAENFEATTGAPLEDKAYTWTAAAYLELLSIARGDQ